MSLHILANDGIHPKAKAMLEDLGHKVDTEPIPQDLLSSKINNYDVVIVRSATKLKKDIIDKISHTKLLIRAGVGIDNIDVEAARAKGIEVRNTPNSSSLSVAELVFSSIFAISRFIYKAGKLMPEKGSTDFKKLKKAFSSGSEVSGKTLGIIGFGRIGQEVAKIALGLQMKIVVTDIVQTATKVDLNIAGKNIEIPIVYSTIDEVLQQSDIVSVHTPSLSKPLIGKNEFEKMKDGVILVNCSRGGVIEENSLIEFLDNGKVKGACLDVFANEPNPDNKLLNHDRILSTPHIGASTQEAQERIGNETIAVITSFFNN